MAHNVKKKKQNKYLPFVILCAVLVVLFIAYTAMSAANDRAEAERLAEEEAANTAIVLAAKDVNTTTSISYSKNGGEKMTFTLTAGKWSYEKDSKFPLDQTKITYMANAIANIQAVCAIEGGDNGEYGFDNPAYKITAAYSDGTQNSYEIGNYNSFNGSYYFKADGDIYMISAGLIPYFDYDENELAALDTIPTSAWADVNYITDITLTVNGETNTISDAEGKESFVGAIGNISLTEFVDYYADDDEKAAFGIDNSTTAAVKYREAVTSTDESGNQSTNYLETTLTLSFGDMTDDGYRYAATSKSDIVYLVDPAAVDSVLEYVDYAPVEEATDDIMSDADITVDKTE